MSLPNDRFIEAPLSRFLVTNLESETVTFLDRLASDRSATFTRNAPFELSCTVPSDNPEVYIRSGSAYDDTEPFVEEGTRLVYWFLRYGDDLSSSAGPWECVGSAIILNIEDSADGAIPDTTFTAYDPWKLLYKLPVVDPETSALPDPEFPIRYDASNAVGIAYQVFLAAQVAYPDFKHHIDWDEDWIADSPATEITEMEFTHGMSVGEAWDNLVKSDAQCDLYLKPVYDPVARPGILCELHGAPKLGVERHEAIFSWDRWPHSLVGITRQRDGEQRANFISYYHGTDQAPVSDTVDDDSVDEFGLYWESQSFPGVEDGDTIKSMARREINLRSRGLKTYTISPASERMPLLLKEFHIHDRVQVYASKRLRRPIVEPSLRVESIPISIDDDQLARVNQLLVAAVPTPVVGTP